MADSSRRLAAVLFSDIVGYSAQVSDDESAALARLEIHNTIFRDEIERVGGRVIKTIGDAFMVEFVSAVDAVSCGLAVQLRLREANSQAATAERMDVRVGVHVGDVVEQAGDLFGETVNVAARLEGKAPVGSVCVSSSVYEQLHKHVQADCEELGPLQLKGIEQAVLAFALRPSASRLQTRATASPPVEGSGPAIIPKTESGRRKPYWQLAVGAMIVVVALAFVWRLQGTSSSTRNHLPANALGVSVMGSKGAKKVEHEAELLKAALSSEFADRCCGVSVVTEAAQIRTRLADGTVDVALVPPLVYVQLREQLPDLSLLARVSANGASSYQSVIITRSGSELSTLSSLRGRTFCWVSESSTSGYLVPSAMFRAQGLDPTSLFARSIFAGSHMAAIRALLDGKCDAAAIHSNTLGLKEASDIPSGVFQTIATSQAIPFDAVVARPGLAPPTIDRLRRALLQSRIGMRKPGGTPSGEWDGFATAIDADYEPLRFMARARHLRVAGYGARGVFDYYYAVPTLAAVAIHHIAEHLIAFDAQGDPLPGVVSQTLSSDGLSLTLRLADNVRFHSHPCLKDGLARDATSQDVAYSIELAMSHVKGRLPIAGYKSGKGDIAGMVAVDKRTVHITFEHPSPLVARTLGDVWLLPDGFDRCQNVRDATHPIGTGPFRYNPVASGETLHLVRNEEYWDMSRAAQAPILELLVLNDPTEAIGRLISGDIDIFGGIGPRQEAPIVREPSGPRLVDELAETQLVVGSRIYSAEWRMLALIFLLHDERRAIPVEQRTIIADGLDRPRLCEASTLDLVATDRVYSSDQLGFDPGLPRRHRTIREARAAMALLGKRARRRITLGTQDNELALADEFRRQMHELGIDITTGDLSKSSLAKLVDRGGLDAMLIQLAVPTFGGEPNVARLRGALERMGLHDDELEELVLAVESEASKSARADRLAEVEARLLETAPLIPLGHVKPGANAEIYIASPKVRGFIEPVTNRVLERGPRSALFTDVFVEL